MRAYGQQRRLAAPGARRRTTASFLATLMVGGGLVGGLGTAVSLSSPAQALTVPRSAAPTSATDKTKVPHYFGPYPNWALSPLTTSTAEVKITDPAGGSGATATANIDPTTGVVSTIDVTAPGSGYSTPTVTVVGGTTDALATATVSAAGTVTGFTVDPATGAGGGYSSFDVALTGGGGSGATAQASGSVDAVTIDQNAPGANYTFPVVEFALPDLPDGRQAKGHVEQADLGTAGEITKVTIDDGGSGYLKAPEVVVHNGTVYDPVAGNTPVTLTATLKLDAVSPLTFGSGYTSAPAVAVTDPTGAGTGAVATASVDAGAITAITVDPNNAGGGFLTQGIKKFQDQLPMPCDPSSAGGCPTSGKFIPIAVPDTASYPGADTYEIGLIQYRTQFSSDLPPTLTRGYVQLVPQGGSVTGAQNVPLQNELLDGSKADTGYTGVTAPQWLGPFIIAKKNRPVRVVFRNLLPTGTDGDLFLPADSSMMGSGTAPMADNTPMPDPVDNGTVLDQVRNPDCTQTPKPAMCFTDNRAELHLHGGTTPWISDGTPHQWITPAGENTAWPQGVSVSDVPDMKDANGNTACADATDGCQTFFYTNQQSARLMFYHDHSWGITRLNVYAGEAAGYQITDDTEQKMVTDGVIPGAGDTLPLIVQDRTFVPKDSQLAAQDPTWDKSRWGGEGSFWYHHVYMPAQNPGDPSGMSAYGRWMYGPWFWPPAAGTRYGPIDNPYYDPKCELDVPATWQYQTDPFCEPKQIPGTPNVSAGMEQFNDTPIVNGVAYPTVELQPKSYRVRLLNAANDRFFNLQWYKADTDPANGGLGGTDGSEVRLKASELAAAQLDPNVSPTPAAASGAGTNSSSDGPDWIQIGSEGGLLPAPAVIDGQQPTTWITDPTRFDVGNVDLHSMLIAPAERSDAIVDFSAFAGQTLILYNDAPAAFPARVSTYDYYTGAPDLSPTGAPKILPGYGPNTRTIMKVKIADVAPAPAFNLTRLQNAFKHTLNGTGAFESGQHPVIVGQSAYNSAYGTSFVSSGNCSVGTKQTCDGLVRINDTSQLNFNTLRSPTTRVSMKLQPKAIHDEMNSSTFDEFGRMQANLGVEASPPTPGAQNVTLYPYVNPQTELIDGTNLPTSDKVTPIASMSDGTQIWRITHNGVDTHPIHFHLFDVQLLNRVTWDNIIIKPDPNELGWKDTVRVSPLEDTIVALRPVVPKLPFEIPNSVRPLNPMEPIGSQKMFNSVDVNGNPTAAVENQLVNFGWEYVFHCHILSHEEMDMMRPVSLVLPPKAPTGLTSAADPAGGVAVAFTDNSIAETSYLLQKGSTDANGVTTWTTVASKDSPLVRGGNSTGPMSLTDPNGDPLAADKYQVVARNTVGYGGEFPSMTAVSSTQLTAAVPANPTDLAAAVTAGPAVALTWTDHATNETGFVVERSTDNGATWTVVGSPAANTANGATAFTDTTVTAGGSYTYRVGAVVPGGTQYSGTVSVQLVGAPTSLSALAVGSPGVALGWTDNAVNETGFAVERSADAGVTWQTVTSTVPAVAGTGGNVSFTDTTVSRGTEYRYRVSAVNGADVATSGTVTMYVIAAPTGLTATQVAGPAAALQWTGRADSFLVQRSTDGGGTWVTAVVLPAGNGLITYTDPGAVPGSTYTYRVTAQAGTDSVASPNVSVPIVAPATNLTVTPLTGPLRVRVRFTDVATNETGYLLERSVNGGAFTQRASWTPRAGGTTTFVDPQVALGNTYAYQVVAVAGVSRAVTGPLTVRLMVPAAVTGVTGSATVRTATTENLTVRWSAATDATGYQVQWRYPLLGNTGGTATVGNVTTYTRTATRTTVQVRVRGTDAFGNGAWSGWVTVARP